MFRDNKDLIPWRDFMGQGVSLGEPGVNFRFLGSVPYWNKLGVHTETLQRLVGVNGSDKVWIDFFRYQPKLAYEVSGIDATIVTAQDQTRQRRLPADFGNGTLLGVDYYDERTKDADQTAVHISSQIVKVAQVLRRLKYVSQIESMAEPPAIYDKVVAATSAWLVPAGLYWVNNLVGYGRVVVPMK